jgi:hypothetical protein
MIWIGIGICETINWLEERFEVNFIGSHPDTVVGEKPRGIRLAGTCSMAGIASDLVIHTERASLGSFPAEPE